MEITMINVKLYYLALLQNIDPLQWTTIKQYLCSRREQRHISNVLISTSDAHTLTDGATIFLADDVNKIAKFYLQRAAIPDVVLGNIMKTIDFNAVINSKMSILNKSLEDLQAKDEAAGNDNKLGDIKRGTPETKAIKSKLDSLVKCIKTVSLPNKYVPNTSEHLALYTAKDSADTRAFQPSITDDEVERIMLIDDVEDKWKLLLLMGIGVFASHASDRYTEIMKHMAQEQKLYLIIASTDFIYGTNYQFCHGYLSTDLDGMSQEKAIQAMGRVGRNKLQHDYTIRFRNDGILKRIFEHDANKPEVANMAKLFNS
jgi:hypothetical protein